MNIAELAKGKVFEIINTPHPKDNHAPICVLCEREIETPDCLVSKERDGFYLHPVCGKNIGVKFE
ncbi:hypothetical protein ES703_57551 [subsurface metagenome]